MHKRSESRVIRLILPSGDEATIYLSSTTPTVTTQYGIRDATAVERVLLQLLPQVMPQTLVA